ncbi:PAS domain-containing protein [Cyanobacteria bacterium FACHB-471]|nr:PAS domain-containing protein [Cyanobacteria bacterium FACHB-471]
MSKTSSSVSLEDILITEALAQRSLRAANLEAETQALHTLAQQLAAQSQTMLRTLVTVARDLCQAGTAGVSLLEVTAEGEEVFRWIAVTGALADHEGEILSKSLCPCGVCLDHKAPQLYTYPERYFTHLHSFQHPFVEELVLPLRVNDQPLGTLWVLSHTEQQRFDWGDQRLMTSLAGFAAAALQSLSLYQKAEASLLPRETELRSITNVIPASIAFVDSEQRYRFTTQKYEEWFGGFVTNLCGKAIQEVLGETVYATLRPYVEQVLTGEQVTFEREVLLQDGRIRHVEATYVPQFAASGSVEGFVALISDISEQQNALRGRRQAEEALRESEELKQSILESSKDCIKVLALTSEILYISKGGLCLLEIDDPSSILNTIWTDRWQGEDHEKAKAAIAAAKMGNTGQFQGYLPTAKGTPKWWDTIVTPVRDAAGQVVQLVAISRDITEAKRAEAERQHAEMALREAHVQLESALAAGAIYIWRWNIPVDRVVVNGAFAYLFGVDPDIATTEGLPLEFFVQSIHEEDRPRVSAAIQQAIETGREYAAEYRIQTTCGEERWLRARGRVEYDATGKPISFPGALIDITDRKQAEESLKQLSTELEQQLQKFDAVASSVPDFIYTFDLSGRFTYANQPLLDLWQKTLYQAVGKNFFELDYPTELAARLQKKIQDVIATRQPLKDESSYTTAFGTRAYEDIFVPIFNPDGTVQAVAGTTRDITDRKQIEIEREQILQREQAAREAAERVNRIKDEFLAVLSHELRSPLNPILGWIQMIRRGNLDTAKTEKAWKTIERNARLQAQLVDDLLDVSRILQGKLSLRVGQVPLAATIRAAIETVQLAAQAKSIEIEATLDTKIPSVLGDSTRLQQVIWNLLSNAVKFTPEAGQVTVRLEQLDHHAQIKVSDTGVGIHPSFLPCVFECFQQADSATTRRFGGLGLGLAIVRQIVEAHGGTVLADSPGEGQGATFTVRLPLTSAQPTAELDRQPLEDSFDLQGTQILVVDNEPDALEFAAFVLEQAGAEVLSTTSADEALALLSQSTPDVLLSDIGMPDMDGYTLLRRVRLLPPDQGGQIPAIALTAYAAEIDHQQAIKAGFQRHVAKPVEPEALIRTVATLVQQQQQQNGQH